MSHASKHELGKTLAGELQRNMEPSGPLHTTESPSDKTSPSGKEIAVALLTGGADRPYALGLARELSSRGVALDFIGSDELDSPVFHVAPNVKFLNLRGDQRHDVNLARKVSRVLRYYARLILYAATAKPRIFHILWNNKFETFDRTVLMLYYRLLGKTIVLTAHNVNAGVRDSKDSLLNRFTLRIQYRLTAHIFVHTEKMKSELIREYGMLENRVTVIPFGVNNAVRHSSLTPNEAKQQLGIRSSERTILFFGNIKPYKGLECLAEAFQQILSRDRDYRMIIAGRAEEGDKYWSAIKGALNDQIVKGTVLLRAEYIPDDETEIYFKAADVLALPYKYIYESGVLFLGFSFGLPAVVADVGSLREEIREGETGFVFRPEDPVDLASAIERYFASDLYANLSSRRQAVRRRVAEQHSWDTVGDMTVRVYAKLLGVSPFGERSNYKEMQNSLDAAAPKQMRQHRVTSSSSSYDT